MNTNLQKITVKELASNMGVTVRTAERYFRDIKKHYEIKIVCLAHVQNYFKIDAETLKN